VRVHPQQSDVGVDRQVTKPSGRGVPVDAQTTPVDQQRAARPFASCAVNRAADGTPQP